MRYFPNSCCDWNPQGFRSVPVFNGLFLLCFLLTTSSCMAPLEDGLSGEYTGPTNRCQTDESCLIGTCHRERQLCAVEPPEGTTLLARIVMGLTEESKTQVIPVLLDDAKNIHIPLKSLVQTESLNPGIDSQIVFLDRSNTLPGRSPMVEVYRTVQSDFPFFLLPGQYDVTIVPVGLMSAQYPMISLGELTVTEDGELVDSDRAPISVQMPHLVDGQVYPQIRGVLVYRYLTGETLPANGYQLVARDSASGRVVSSTVESGCDPVEGCGWFQLALKPGTRSVVVDISRPSEPWHPVYHRRVIDISGVRTTLSIPVPSPPTRVRGQVTTPSDLGLSPPTPRSHVCFRLLDSTDETSLEYWTTTGEDGQVSRLDGYPDVFLYAGTYEVTVSPIGSGDHSGQWSSVVVSPFQVNPDEAESIELAVKLSSRLRISGAIEVNGVPVPQAMLRALDIVDYQQGLNTRVMVTGDNGRFSGWMDDSLYLVVAEAPTESHFSFGHAIWNLRQSDTWSVTVRLSTPFVLSGHLLWGETPENTGADTHFEGMIIEWYRQFGQIAYLIGRSAVRTDGQFSALLPTQ